MIYITCIIKNSKTDGFMGFDTSSSSPVILTAKVLTDIILNTKIKVANASIHNNTIVIKEWANGLATRSGNTYSGPKYVLIAKERYIYKIVDYSGFMYSMGLLEIKELIESKNIANCYYREDQSIESEDVYEIQLNEEFEKAIQDKYNSFIAKAIVLGCGNMTFSYEIENDEVALTKYTGSSVDIILPPFIAAIKKGAFSNTGIRTIKLSNGLKNIGAMAFSFCKIERIEIPKSVELIGWKAFAQNKHNISMSRVKLQNDKTIILEPTN